MDDIEVQADGNRRMRFVYWPPLAMTAFLLLVTVLLLAYRFVHFGSVSYKVLVSGYYLGVALGILTIPALLIQVASLIVLISARRPRRIQSIAVLPAAINCLVIGVTWVNLSEIFVDDLEPAVQHRLDQAADQIRGSASFSAGNVQLPEGFVLPVDPYNRTDTFVRFFSAETWFLLTSAGPDRCTDVSATLLSADPWMAITSARYDPTNGVFSRGDLIAFCEFSRQ